MQSSVSPLSLPRLSRNEVQARNVIVQRGQTLTIVLQEQTCNLSLHPLLAADLVESAFNPGDWLVQAQWAGAPFDLILPGSAAQSWMGSRFPNLALADIPDCLAAAMLETVFSELSNTKMLSSCGPLQVEILAQDPKKTRALAHCFTFCLSHSDVYIYGRLSTDSLGLMLMAGLMALLPVAQNNLDLEAMPIVLQAEIGSTNLTAEELQGLTVGDCVLFDHAWTGQDQALWLAHANHGVRVQWRDSQLQVIESMHVCDLIIHTEKNTSARQNKLSSTSEVPIELHFDVGQRSMSLACLNALEVGQLLSLDRPLTGKISIRANGAEIGKGELVEVDSRLGVTVLTLFNQEQSDSMRLTNKRKSSLHEQLSADLFQAALEEKLDEAFDDEFDDDEIKEEDDDAEEIEFDDAGNVKDAEDGSDVYDKNLKNKI